MPAREETASPSSLHERTLLAGVASALADGGEILDAAALVGDPPDQGTLTAALREHAGKSSVIVCAGVLERLSDFVGAVETLVALSAERGATVVIAVANDAFAGGLDEQRRSAWGEGAVAELRQLLPAEHLAFDQLALRGAALVPAGEVAQLTVPVEVDPAATVPIGFVLVFGPRASALAPVGSVGAADLRAERTHERARTAELEVLRARLHALDPGSEPAQANGGRPGASG
jgi:hypothetical protein